MTMQISDDRMTPEDITNTGFATTKFGRRGLNEDDVQAFQERVAAEVTRLLAEQAALRQMNAHLQERVRDHEESAAAAVSGNVASEENAIRILSEAQRVADRTVEEARQYNAWVSAAARQRYEQIIGEARQHAEDLADQIREQAEARAAQAAYSVPADVPDAARNETMARMFSGVFREHLRAQALAMIQVLDDLENPEHASLPAESAHQPCT